MANKIIYKQERKFRILVHRLYLIFQCHSSLKVSCINKYNKKFKLILYYYTQHQHLGSFLTEKS